LNFVFRTMESAVVNELSAERPRGGDCAEIFIHFLCLKKYCILLLLVLALLALELFSLAEDNFKKKSFERILKHYNLTEEEKNSPCPKCTETNKC
jgi:hypothetical protein